jgi:hypothetical protein
MLAALSIGALSEYRRGANALERELAVVTEQHTQEAPRMIGYIRDARNRINGLRHRIGDLETLASRCDDTEGARFVPVAPRRAQ